MNCGMSGMWYHLVTSPSGCAAVGCRRPSTAWLRSRAEHGHLGSFPLGQWESSMTSRHSQLATSLSSEQMYMVFCLIASGV